MLTDYSQVPRAFAHCPKADCPQAATCLRQQAYALFPPRPQGADLCPCVNPRDTEQQPCPRYLPDTPVRAARGFRKAHRSVPASSYDWVKVELSDVMGITSFYVFRRGKRLIMPDTQEKILAALRKYGATEPVEFDAYEDILDWGDRLV